MDDLKLTAYHEAGHGVMPYIVRRAFNYVNIIPDEKRTASKGKKRGKRRAILASWASF